MEGISGLFALDTSHQFIFSHKEVSQPYYASAASSTDFDLTGQVLWPSAITLSKYIINHSDMFKDRSFIELGAGVGLCSLIASKYSKLGIVTDYKDEVMACINKNIEEFKNGALLSATLEWGSTKYCSLNIKGEDDKRREDILRGIDFIIGADIVYWEESIKPLIWTLKDISNYCIKKPTILIALKNRVKTVFNGLLEALKNENIKCEFEDISEIAEENIYLLKFTI
jgi:predicted nicotinamide N-methyase